MTPLWKMTPPKTPKITLKTEKVETVETVESFSVLKGVEGHSYLNAIKTAVAFALTISRTIANMQFKNTQGFLYYILPKQNWIDMVLNPRGRVGRFRLTVPKRSQMACLLSTLVESEWSSDAKLPRKRE
jgi:hypothetical protein